MVREFLWFTFAVAESQAGEIKPSVRFCGVKLSLMIADPRKPQTLKHILQVATSSVSS